MPHQMLDGVLIQRTEMTLNRTKPACCLVSGGGHIYRVEKLGIRLINYMAIVVHSPLTLALSPEGRGDRLALLVSLVQVFSAPFLGERQGKGFS